MSEEQMYAITDDEKSRFEYLRRLLQGTTEARPAAMVVNGPTGRQVVIVSVEDVGEGVNVIPPIPEVLTG